MKRLLLLGAGRAHLHLLRALARQPLAAAAEVTLVTPGARALHAAMLPGVVAGHYHAEQATIALAPLAAAAGVRLVDASAAGLDAARRQVLLADGRRIEYDLLSIGSGAAMDRERLPGARAHALFVRPYERFLAQLEALLDAASMRALDVVVVGGGATGVELALALQFRLALMSGPAVAGAGGAEAGRVALVIGGERVLPDYPAAVARHAEVALNRARVTLFRDRCVEVKRDALVLASGARVACDVPVLATGPEAPAWLAGSGLALDGHGFVVTGPTLQSGSHPEVFATGDVATRIDAPHARDGGFALAAGPALTANLRAACAGAGPGGPGGLAPGQAGGVPLQRHDPPARTLNLLSCGRRKAIASRGGLTAQGRWVWWWKDHVDRAFVARYSMGAAVEPVAVVAGAGPAPADAPASVAPGAPIPPIPSAGTR